MQSFDPDLNMFDFNPDKTSFPNGHFIGGVLVNGEGDMLEVRRPSDGMVYAELPIAAAAIVDRAVSNAQAAFQTSDWATGAPRARARILRRWAELIETRSAELARIEALGSTRPINEVLAVDIPYAADCLRFFAECADKLGGDVAAMWRRRAATTWVW